MEAKEENRRQGSTYSYVVDWKSQVFKRSDDYAEDVQECCSYNPVRRYHVTSRNKWSCISANCMVVATLASMLNASNSSPCVRGYYSVAVGMHHVWFPEENVADGDTVCQSISMAAP